MSKYIVRNCKALISNDICELYSQKGIHLMTYCYCRDTNCKIKQIIELCGKYHVIDTGYQKVAINYLSSDILKLLDIQEVEQMKRDTHLVLKWDWINNNLTAEERKIFDILVNKSRIRNHEYYVVNLDEPYADKVKDIIQKNEQNTETDIPSACNSFKERIIAYLVESGLYYDKTIESSEHHKFIAWKTEKASQEVLDEVLTKIYFVIDVYILEHFDRYDASKISFNIRDCECLTDKDTGDRLFRTLINFRINE